jgi:chromate transporter
VEAPSLGALFLGFAGLGLMGFGGVLPLAHRMLVERKRWLSQEAFTELLGLCQFLPGGNIINLSVAVGLRYRGAAGAIAALLGLIAPPFAILIGLGIVYGRFSDDPLLRHGFSGLAAAACGLLVSLAVKVALPLRRRPLAALLAVICCAAVAFLRVPLLLTLAVLAPASALLLAWRRE